jgi:hypothetical protein
MPRSTPIRTCSTKAVFLGALRLFRPYLAPCLQLRLHFPNDTRRQPRVFFTKETHDAVWVSLGELAQRPGQRLHDHLVTVGDKRATDIERPIWVTTATSSPRVQGDCRNKRQPTTPPIA